MMRETTTFVFT